MRRCLSLITWALLAVWPAAGWALDVSKTRQELESLRTRYAQAISSYNHAVRQDKAIYQAWAKLEPFRIRYADEVERANGELSQVEYRRERERYDSRMNGGEDLATPVTETLIGSLGEQLAIAHARAVAVVAQMNALNEQRRQLRAMLAELDEKLAGAHSRIEAMERRLDHLGD